MIGLAMPAGHTKDDSVGSSSFSKRRVDLGASKEYSEESRLLLADSISSVVVDAISSSR